MLSFIHWNIDPVIFHAGSFSLRYYTLLFMLAFYASYLIMAKIYRKANVPLNLLDKLTVYIILATIAGARLGHCLFYGFDYYKEHIAEIFLPFHFSNGTFVLTGYQGLASHGGVAGILIAVFLYCRKYRTAMFWLLDRLSVVAALSGCFIRIGNLFNSEITGRATDVPWAFIFVREDLIPRHPAQLYESLSYLLIFFLLARLYKSKARVLQPGFMFGLFLILVFGARFAIEFLKENQEAFESKLPLNMGQLLSLPLIGYGIWLVTIKSRVAPKRNIIVF